MDIQSRAADPTNMPIYGYQGFPYIGKKGALTQQSCWTTEPLSSGPPILQCHNNVARLLQHLGTKAGASTRAALTVCRAPLQMLEAKAGTLSLALVGQATLRACSSHFSGRDLELVPPPFGADGSHGTRYAPALLNIHKASAFLAKHSHAPYGRIAGNVSVCVWVYSSVCL